MEEEGGQKSSQHLFFPGLCKGLIKYRWCLEQSRGKWDSANSTSSLGRPNPVVMEPCCLFSFFSPSSSSFHLSPLLPSPSPYFGLPRSFPDPYLFPDVYGSIELSDGKVCVCSCLLILSLPPPPLCSHLLIPSPPFTVMITELFD